MFQEPGDSFESESTNFFKSKTNLDSYPSQRDFKLSGDNGEESDGQIKIK